MNRLSLLDVCSCSIVLLAQGCTSAPGGRLQGSRLHLRFHRRSWRLAKSAIQCDGDRELGGDLECPRHRGRKFNDRTIDSQGKYTAPAATQSFVTIITVASKREPSVVASASVLVAAPSSVTATKNPQVALYTVTPLAANASAFVQFGTDMNYGLTTWTQSTPPGGGPMGIHVAGMRANTTYHMRAVVQYAGGQQTVDADKTFTTGSLPQGLSPVLPVTTTAMTPQSGVELLDLSDYQQPSQVQIAVADSPEMSCGVTTHSSERRVR